jgi:hypothetical protein
MSSSSLAHAGSDEKKVDDKPEEKIVALDDTDIQILKTYVSRATFRQS